MFYSSRSSSTTFKTINSSDDGFTYMKDDLEKERKQALQLKKVSAKSQNPKAKYIVSGVRICDGEKIFIISNVYEKQCDCLYRYEQQMKAYLEQEKRRKLQEQTVQSDQKHIITGVAISPSGNPIYILGGVAPPHRCNIIAEREKLIKEHEIMTAKPALEEEGTMKMKYFVNNIINTNNGDVYVIGDAKKVNKCECLKLFEKFYAHHRPCMQTFEDFQAQIATDTCEYLMEMDPVYRARSQEQDPYNLTNEDKNEDDDYNDNQSIITNLQTEDSKKNLNELQGVDVMKEQEDISDDALTITISIKDKNNSKRNIDDYEDEVNQNTTEGAEKEKLPAEGLSNIVSVKSNRDEKPNVDTISNQTKKLTQKVMSDKQDSLNRKEVPASEKTKTEHKKSVYNFHA